MQPVSSRNNVSSPHTVTVLGAGIVGLSIALRLHLDGFSVTVIERGEPMHGASFGNAGYLTEANIFPPASPDMLRQLPKLILSKDGPLVVRPHYAMRMIPWAVKAVAALRPASYQHIVSGLARLTSLAYDSFEDLVGAADARHLLTRDGGLIAFRTLAGLESKSRALLPLWKKFGFDVELASAECIRHMEPALSKAIVGGLHFRHAGRCSNPRGLGERYEQRLRAGGVRFLRDEVRQVDEAEDGVRIHTSTGSIFSDRVVLAMGFQTAALLRKMGVRVPLASERGYHLMLPASGVGLKRPVVFGEPHFMATPMDEGLRLAGTAEFAQADSRPDMRRAWMLGRLARQYLPDLNDDGAQPWMGVRPSLPDGLPAIGILNHSSGIAYAFGHAHTGLTLSAITARCISSLLQKREPPVDTSPYCVERFLHTDHR